MIAFRGGCDISLANMADLEDKQAGKSIYSEDMLHFIFESFRCRLPEMILWQHLFASSLVELLYAGDPSLSIRRKGNDIYVLDRKLSISVATVSTVSSLLHFGINISSANTPVPTISLGDMGLDAADTARQILANMQAEYTIAEKALYKVKPV